MPDCLRPTRWVLLVLAASAAGQDSRPASAPAPVDLGDHRHESIQDVGATSDKPRAWYQNIDLWGFGSAAFLDTGNTGFRPDGSFLIKEASLYLAAHASTELSFLAEVKLVRPGFADDLLIRLGEAYVHARDPLRTGSPDALNAKFGRFDLPFGEEYLIEDSIDNPMINYTAAYPYGLDEGVLIYGKQLGIGWIASVTDGNGQNGNDDNSDKAFNVKVHGRPYQSLQLSASGMRTGRTSSSALGFGGPGIMPVGVNFASTLGRSPSAKVDGLLWEVDARQEFGQQASLWLSVGGAEVKDDAPGFDRDLWWFAAEPRVNLSSQVYVVGRFSEFGSYSDGEGYLANGKITASGLGPFGYDVSRLQRLALCVGYRPLPHVVVKAEIGRDRFWVIDASPFLPENDNRLYYGLEVTVGF